MNRYLILLCVCVGSLMTTFAQQKEPQPLYTRAGFKIGANYSTVNGDIENADARLRVHMGAVIAFPITQRFLIQTELLYSAQGFTLDTAGVEEKISLNYLTLPIIFKYYITERFGIETGPQFALLNTARSSTNDNSREFSDQFNNFDFGWGIGGVYQLKSGLFFQARYVFGLTNFSDVTENDETNRHGIGQLSIGYLFKTKNNRREDTPRE